MNKKVIKRVYPKIKEHLISISDSKLAEFNRKICPDTKLNILGIKMSTLRKIAKDIANGNILKNTTYGILDYKGKKDELIWKVFLNEAQDENMEYLEEVEIQGLVIGYLKIDLDDKLKLIENFVPKIDSWAITDTVCSTIKIKEQELQKLWNFIVPYTQSEKEFEARFGIIMMLDFFLTPKYVDKVIGIIDKIQNRNYYVQMAIAWTLCEIEVQFDNKTISYLKGKNNLDKFTYNKTLQKMIESYRIPKSEKNEIKSMKKK